VIDFSKLTYVQGLRKNWKLMFPPDITLKFLVDLGPDYLDVAADTTDPDKKKLKWMTVMIDQLDPDVDREAAKTLCQQGWSTISYAWENTCLIEASGLFGLATASKMSFLSHMATLTTTRVDLLETANHRTTMTGWCRNVQLSRFPQ